MRARVCVYVCVCVRACVSERGRVRACSNDVACSCVFACVQYLALSASPPRIHDHCVPNFERTINRDFFPDDVNNTANFVTEDSAIVGVT